MANNDTTASDLGNESKLLLDNTDDADATLNTTDAGDVTMDTTDAGDADVTMDTTDAGDANITAATVETTLEEDDLEPVTMATDGALTTEEALNDRADDLTRSILGLDAGMMGTPSMRTTKRGLGRYKTAMKGGIPFRFTKPKHKEELPVSHAGLFSLMTFGWQTSMMWNIFRKGIDSVKHLYIPETERAKFNTDRLDRIWCDEVKRHGPVKASFARALWHSMSTRVMWASLVVLDRMWQEELSRKGKNDASLFLTALRASRTRMILIVILMFGSSFCTFIQPAFLLHWLLSYLNSGDVKISTGIGLVAIISATELVRTLLFALAWHYNYTTGVRIKAAAQSLLFRKILKLRNLEDKTVGELVNLLGNDSMRIFEAIALGPLVLPGPLVLLMGLIYIYTLIGPWSFVAIGTYVLFYPFMLFISKASAYFRRKCIAVTDKRVRIMNELLTCIKLIKMYAWEKSFAKAVSGIRADEKNVLERAAYVQSVSTATSPMVTVMSAVFTFTGYILTGNEVSAVDAFTIIAVLNSLRFTLSVLPFASKAMADAKVSFKRFQAILLMDEMTSHPWQIFDDKYAVVLNDATFRWEKESETSVNGSEGQKVKEKPGQQNGTHASAVKEELQALKAAEDHGNGDAAFVDVPTLQNISFTVEKGKLLGICGSVGCGKSSILSAILGRMIRKSGKIAVNGSMAYVTQQAWITNTTVRDNILFGAEYEADRYATVVEACALLQDFSDFVDGDQTEIGERGINLSGGQKQRISLARAVYSDRDIYLLDDPLSAVDIHVGRHIFSECIKKTLKGKSVLFVTHQLQYLSQCDSVMFVRDGVVADMGSHAQLMSGDTEYANLIKMFYTKDKEKSKEEKAHPKSLHKQFSVDSASLLQRTLSSGSRQRTISQGSVEAPASPKLKRDMLRQMSVWSSQGSGIDETDELDGGGGKLIVAEEKSEGRVGFAVYAGYLKAAGGFITSALVLLVFVLSIASQSFAAWWLSYWFNQGSGNTTIQLGNETVISHSISDNPDLQFYVQIYGASVVVMVLLTYFRGYIFVKATLKASSKMHNDIFSKMLSSPMQFFDTTPVGRIMNRFSADLDEIDVRLPFTAEIFLQNILLVVASLMMICYVSPWFLLAMLPAIVFFVVLNIIFASGIRELMKMTAITKSPLISHVTASIQGISTIHAYGKMEEFQKKFDELMDKNSLYFYLFLCANRWLAVRLDGMSSFIIGMTGVCIVVTYDNLTPAMAGLAMAFAIQMTGLLQFTIRIAIDVEAKFVAVQRLQHYSENVEPEAPAIIQNNRPPQDWPQKGEIKFDKYKMKYRDNLPLALKGIAFTVKRREKIGIVGRSGSGKSSLGVALFRLVEPASGTIFIDGIDVTKIGVEDLRSRLSIIPQDPVLFVGTVRYNLDPFGKHQDSELWTALEKCHVKDSISSLELKLDHMVVENGENFSVGERQLLCMARAVLRNSKILMLDEATAAIDTETDALVQTTIKEAFADCTMLIIAHRLNTVLHCDRILVMEEGKVIEYGKPSDLLGNADTKFKAMFDVLEKQNEHL